MFMSSNISDSLKNENTIDRNDDHPKFVKRYPDGNIPSLLIATA
jgi:hypothetical protein